MRPDHREEAMEERGTPSGLWGGIWRASEISLDFADHARDLFFIPPRAVLRASPGPHGSRPVGFSLLGRSRWLPVSSCTSEPATPRSSSLGTPTLPRRRIHLRLRTWRAQLNSRMASGTPSSTEPGPTVASKKTGDIHVTRPTRKPTRAKARDYESGCSSRRP